jgi:hypothetical protein
VNAEAVAGHPGRPPPLGHNRKESVVEKKLIVGGLALLGLVGLAPVSARGEDTSNFGKHVSASSLVNIDMTTDPWPALGVRIEKGKKKHLLKVDAVANEYNLAPTTLAIVVAVNGVDMEPADFSSSQLTTRCDSHCTLSATWWLDLDTAELKHPGVFIKQPLDVTMWAGSPGGPTLGRMSLVATLLKK